MILPVYQNSLLHLLLPSLPSLSPSIPCAVAVQFPRGSEGGGRQKTRRRRGDALNNSAVTSPFPSLDSLFHSGTSSSPFCAWAALCCCVQNGGATDPATISHLPESSNAWGKATQKMAHPPAAEVQRAQKDGGDNMHDM